MANEQSVTEFPCAVAWIHADMFARLNHTGCLFPALVVRRVLCRLPRARRIFLLVWNSGPSFGRTRETLAQIGPVFGMSFGARFASVPRGNHGTQSRRSFYVRLAEAVALE